MIAWSSACILRDTTTTRTPSISMSALGPRLPGLPAPIGPVRVNLPSLKVSTRAVQANGMPSDLPPSDSDTSAPAPAARQAAALSASLIRQNNAFLAR